MTSYSFEGAWFRPRRTGNPIFCDPQWLHSIKMGRREDTRGRRRTNFPPLSNRQGWTGQRRSKRLLESSRMDPRYYTICGSHKVVTFPGEGNFVASLAGDCASTCAGTRSPNNASGYPPSSRQSDIIQMGRNIPLYCRRIERSSDIVP